MTASSRALAQAAPAEAAPAAAPVEANIRSLGFLVQDVARLLRNDFGARVAGAGLELTTGEARALVHAVSAAGSRQTEIADRMGVEPMTLCGYVDRLEARGLVERQPHPDDKRAKRIVPTDAAAEAISSIMPLTRGMIADAVEGLPEEDVATFRRVLEHIRVKLSESRRES